MPDAAQTSEIQGANPPPPPPEAAPSPPVQGAPAESAPQQPYTITGPATERVNQAASQPNPTENSAPAPLNTPEPAPQQPPTPPSPDAAIASQLAGQATEAPPSSQPGIITNRTTEEGLAEGQSNPATPEPEQNKYHDATTKEELAVESAFEPGDAQIVKNPQEEFNQSNTNQAPSPTTEQVSTNQAPESVTSTNTSRSEAIQTSDQGANQQPQVESSSPKSTNTNTTPESSEPNLSALTKPITEQLEPNESSPTPITNTFHKLDEMLKGSSGNPKLEKLILEAAQSIVDGVAKDNDIPPGSIQVNSSNVENKPSEQKAA